MNSWTRGRRAFLKRAGMTLAMMNGELTAQQTFGSSLPNSSGTEPPQFRTFEGACDCHHYIYDARFPFTQRATPMISGARVADYRLLQRRIGTTRNVIVTPALYPASFADNLVTLDAVGQFGIDARGVAVVSPTITDSELKALHDGGIRGIRFSLAAFKNATSAIEDIEVLAVRVRRLEWHVQFNMTADQIVQVGNLWKRFPCPVVFDYLGHLSEPTGVNHPAFKIIRRLLDEGLAWVKLSVTHDSSKIGPPTYADLRKVGQAFVRAAPERMLWGSNWPHSKEINKPDDAVLFDLLAAWAPGERTRQRILVKNPEELYGFAQIEE
jgi:D-galactarolactone isomerase